MKKILCLAAMLFLAFCAFAQSPQNGDGPVSLLIMTAQEKADLMKGELSLTSQQYKNVLNVFKQEEKAINKDQSDIESPKLSEEELQTIMDKKVRQLQKILTYDQFQKWENEHPEEFEVRVIDPSSLMELQQQ